jgi:hypothetical protein
VAVGSSSGVTVQGLYAVAVGFGAGSSGQGLAAVAVGGTAGFGVQGTGAVAVGSSAGMTAQGQYAAAVGFGAGASGQGDYSVAVGPQDSAAQSVVAGSAVAIGHNAVAGITGYIVVGENVGFSPTPDPAAMQYGIMIAAPGEGITGMSSNQSAATLNIATTGGLGGFMLRPVRAVDHPVRHPALARV